LLWVTPAGVLILGALALAITARRRRGLVETVAGELTDEEQARLAEVLGGKDAG
jgi:cytochrome c-type biogenesis protein CcmH/NrfF